MTGSVPESVGLLVELSVLIGEGVTVTGAVGDALLTTIDSVYFTG